jgi:hypothetical protein
MAMRAMIVIGLVTACAAAPRPAPRLMPRLTLATPARSVPVPTVAAAAAVVAPAAFAPAAWSLEGGAAWSATGALTAQVCCTGWLKATRPLALPAGGAVEVDAVAPCARGVVVAVRGAGPTIWAGGGPGAAPFAGTLTLAVPPSTSPRTLELYAEGGLHCCGEVRIDAVRIRGLP